MAKLSELYKDAAPLISKIFANDLRIRIILCLNEKARFFDEIVDFVEAEKYDVRQELHELEKLEVVECVDEIYSLTRLLGKPSAYFLRKIEK